MRCTTLAKTVFFILPGSKSRKQLQLMHSSVLCQGYIHLTNDIRAAITIPSGAPPQLRRNAIPSGAPPQLRRNAIPSGAPLSGAPNVTINIAISFTISLQRPIPVPVVFSTN